MKENIQHILKLFLICFLLTTGKNISAQDITYTVNTYSPALDGNNTAGSLSKAIQVANANLNQEILIVFAPGVNDVLVEPVNGISDSFTCLPIKSRTKNLTIDGACSVVIRRFGGLIQGFSTELASGSEQIIFKNITIKDFETGYEGAAIYNRSHLILDNVNFINNQTTAEMHPGGAVMSYGGDVTFRNRVFFQDNKSSDFGGAICVHTSKLIIEDGCEAVFLRNSALKGGGAIYSYGSQVDVKNPLSLVFTANTVTQTDIVPENGVPGGGAILHSTNQAYAYKLLDLKNATFNSNKAISGGAVTAATNTGTDATTGASIHLANCTFSGNSASYKDENGGYGGAVSQQGTLIMDENCVFTNNTASSAGGAIYYVNSSNAPYDLDVYGIFRNNVAKDGGAILAQKAAKKVNIHGKGPSGKISVFDQNKATTGNGGFLCALGVDVTVDGGEGNLALFTDNTAGWGGGALYTYKSKEVNVTNAAFYRNTQTHPVENVEGLGGGAITVVSKLSEDTEETAVPCTLTLKNARFEYNEATQGGAVYIQSEIGKLQIADAPGDLTRFYANGASYEAVNEEGVTVNAGLGGAIFSQGVVTINLPALQPQIENATFHNNHSGSMGGAIFCSNNLTVNNAYFHQNNSSDGAGIYLRLDTNETGTITNSRFLYNYGGIGSAISLDNQVSDGNGGLIATNSGVLDVRNSEFQFNRASQGAAIHGIMPSNLIVWSNLFNENWAIGDNHGTAYGNGGAIYCRGGVLNVGDVAGPGYGNTFTNNWAYQGTASGAAIYATGNVNIVNNTFKGNLAGYGINTGTKESPLYQVRSGSVITVGNYFYGTGTIQLNTIQDNKGEIGENGYDNIFSVNSHGIGFHNEWSDQPIIGLKVEKNIIQGNNYGINVTPNVKQIEITQNTFGRNTKSINTGQNSPRKEALDANLSSLGNLGIGKMMLVYPVNKGANSFDIVAAVPTGLVSGSVVEFYKSDNKKETDATSISYLQSLQLDNSEIQNAHFNRTLSLSGFNPDAETLMGIVIDANKNTSEFNVNSIVLQVNINDAVNSGIDWNNAVFSGKWNNDYAFSDLSENTYSTYPGPEKINGTSGQIFLQSEDTPKWEVTLNTSNGLRFGSWSFDGLNGDTINMETYRMVQNYNFSQPYTTGSRVDDYKLLAIVDGTGINHFRNNRYISEGNINGGNTAGGGGLFIKKGTGTGSPESVVLNNSVTPTGSVTAGKMSAGFIVVDKDADFLIDGTGTFLDMSNITSNATSAVYGPRLVIEKDYETCGIFALENGAVLSKGTNFMSLYHHVMDDSKWSWLSAPEAISFSPDQTVDKLLYTASTPSDKFTAKENAAGNNLYIYSYNESLRANTKPEFGQAGTAWAKTGSNVNGFIATIFDNSNTARDLYMQISQPESTFSNGQKSAVVTWTKCQRLDQYQAAAKYLGKPVPESIDAADAETQTLVASYHSGWNLVGNLYSKSFVPGDDMGVIAVRNKDDSGYTYKNLLGVTLGTVTGDGFLSYFPGEGEANYRLPALSPFYVQIKQGDTSPKNINGTFSFDNLFLRSASAQDNQLVRIDLLSNDQIKSETVLTFSEKATPTMDWGLDVPLMSSSSSDIYFPDGMGQPMAILVPGNNAAKFSVPVGVKAEKQGNYTFHIREMKNMPGNVYLIDGSTKILLSEGDNYTFNIDKGNVENRFKLVSESNTAIKNIDKNLPVVYVKNGQIIAENLSGNAELSVMDISGKLRERASSSDEKYIFSVQDRGHYLVRITKDGQIYTTKVIL